MLVLSPYFVCIMTFLCLRCYEIYFFQNRLSLFEARISFALAHYMRITVALADHCLRVLINIHSVCDINVEMILYYVTVGFH